MNHEKIPNTRKIHKEMSKTDLLKRNAEIQQENLEIQKRSEQERQKDTEMAKELILRRRKNKKSALFNKTK